MIVQLKARGAKADKASKDSVARVAVRKEIVRREIAHREIGDQGGEVRMAAGKVAVAREANVVTTGVAAIAGALKDRLKSISRN